MSFRPFVRIWGIDCGFGISVGDAFFRLRIVLSRVLQAIFVFRSGISGMPFLVLASGCCRGLGRSVVHDSAKIVCMTMFVCPWGACRLFRVPLSRVHVCRSVLASCCPARLWSVRLEGVCCRSCPACGLLCAVLRRYPFQCSRVSRCPSCRNPCSSCLGVLQSIGCGT